MNLRTAAVALALAAAGCRTDRLSLAEPITDQTLEVRSGERWKLVFDDPHPETSAWSAKCNDDHIEVTYERIPAVREDGRTVEGAKCVVHVRLHRGFGGPTDLTVRCRDRRTGKTVRRVAFGLYCRTGDYAFWK